MPGIGRPDGLSSRTAFAGPYSLQHGKVRGGSRLPAGVARQHHITLGYTRISSFNCLAEAYLQAAQGDEGSDRAEWLKRADKACRAAIKFGKAAREGMPEAMRLKGTYEWLKGNAAAAQRWWQKSLAEAERRGMRYESGLTHLELGQRLGERAHLEQAGIIFAELGVEWLVDW